MHPILFELGPLKVYSYGLMVALGFIAATYLVRLEASRQDINPQKLVNLVFVLTISGILGARILYIFQNLNLYIKNPWEIVMLHKGGLSFYGGFILATICAIVFLKRQHLSVLKVFDLVAPYLALAQAIGRIGCLLNGCCYGKPTDSLFSLYFPGEKFARYPVQIYASLSLLSMFIILRTFQAKQWRRTKILGQTFLLYCLLYAISRFFMEYLRGDTSPILANLTIHQLISIGIIVISAGCLWKKMTKK